MSRSPTAPGGSGPAGGDKDKPQWYTPSLRNLEKLADMLVDARKTRMNSRDPIMVGAFLFLAAWVFVVEVRTSAAGEVGRRVLRVACRTPLRPPFPRMQNVSAEYHAAVPAWMHQAACVAFYSAVSAHILQIFSELDPFRRNLLYLVSYINCIA